MANFYMTIGCAASGKSTWCHDNSKYYDVVLDSDLLRLELLGDEKDQSNNDLVFRTMYKRAYNALKEGHNVFYCACNLGMKYRIHILSQLRAKFTDVIYTAVVFNTPIDDCRISNAKRGAEGLRTVPDWLFEKQIKQLQLPVQNEGWDKIIVINRYKDAQDVYKIYSEVKDKVKNFGSQQNKHHALSLIDHCDGCGRIATTQKASYNIATAAFIHDYGKAYTATHWPAERDDGQLHYPSHAEYGAYLALNMGYNIDVARLVNYHMIPYMDESAQTTWKKRLGDTIWKDIMELHKYDELAH